MKQKKNQQLPNSLIMDQFSIFYTLALKYLQARQRSIEEMRSFLRKKKTPDELVEKVINKLTEKKFLNDEEFARLWIESRNRVKPRSEWLLKRELAAKGIARPIIDAIFQEISGENGDLERAKKVIERKVNKYLHLKRHEIYQKLGAFLARRGFDWDTSKSAIDDLLKDRYNTDE